MPKTLPVARSVLILEDISENRHAGVMTFSFRNVLVPSLIGAVCLAVVACTAPAGDSTGRVAEEEAKAISPWDCSAEADAFDDLNIACVSLGQIVTGERMALVMTCYTADGDDGLWDYNVIRATIRGDFPFGASPTNRLDEFADVALDEEEPEQIGIYRRDDHFTINHEPWAESRGSSQWDTLMNKLENHVQMTIRLADEEGRFHSSIIRTDRLEEPLMFMESRGCVRNVSLY